MSHHTHTHTHTHTGGKTEDASQSKRHARLYLCSSSMNVCVPVDRWCDLPTPRPVIHPFLSSHPLHPGGKRREPCKGISLYSSLPALPFLFSLFPKHHSCRVDRERERERGKTSSNLHCKNRQKKRVMTQSETKRENTTQNSRRRVERALQMVVR